MTSKIDMISGSEIDSRLSCERKHYYAFGQPVFTDDRETHGIEPLTHGDALVKGNFGHATLEQYYKAVAAGASNNDAKKYAVDFATTEIRLVANDVYKAQLFTENLQLVIAYLNQHGWEVEQGKIKPLAVEHEFRYEVPETGLTLPFKPDVVWQDMETGKVWLVDHKFLYNFYTDKTAPIMPQLVRYGYALQQMKFRVDGALYNMLSTRKNSKSPFRRLEKEFNKNATAQFWNEAVDTMQEIRALKEGPNDEWEKKARRTASDFNCKNCSFLDLCVSDLEGRRGRNILIKSFYKPNSYGYGKEDLEP